MSQQDDFETPSTNAFEDALEHQSQHYEDGKPDTRSDKDASGKDEGAGSGGDDQQDIFQDLGFFIAHDESRQELEQLVSGHGGTVLSELPSGKSNKEFVVSTINTSDLPTVTPTYIKTCCENNVLMKVQPFLVPYNEFRAVIDTQLQNESGEKPTAPADDASETAEQPVESPSTKPGEDKRPDADTPQPSETNGGPMASVTAESNAGSEDQGAGARRESVDSAKNSISGDESDVVKTPVAPSPPSARQPAASHNKSSFTEEEDEFILDVVRKNPTRRTTHTLFDEISHYVPKHTGNSIRHRYRVYLAKRLNFVYQVDSTGKLVRDDNGDLIKTTVLPKSLKNKFTASEDYALSVEVKKQFYRDIYQMDPDTGESLIKDINAPDGNLKGSFGAGSDERQNPGPSFKDFRVGERRGPVPREFFKKYADENPNHTENAWRDRFRKFLLTFGIDRYIEYYENEIAQSRVPQAMKNMTNRPKRPGVPTPGNYNSFAKKVKTLSQQQQQQAAAIIAANGGAIDPAALAFAIPEGDFLDEETLNFISGLRRDLSKIESAGGAAFAYPQEIAESIRNDFTNEEAQFDEIDPDKIPFPPALATNELFMPQFFHFGSTREFLDKINEVISRDYEPSQAEKLVQDLCDDVGVRKTFSTSILTALSGDLMVFPRYFLCMFHFGSNPPMNIPGIWTREDDEMLRSGEESNIKKLTQKHGAGRIEMRKRFIASDLV